MKKLFRSYAVLSRCTEFAKYAFFLFLTFNFITLQTFNCSAQTYTFCPGDTVILGLPTFTGSLQWQQSTDSLTWTDISGAIYQPYKTVFATVKYFRAKIINSTCNPVYSQVRHATLGTCSTCGIIISDYDGNTYNTVSIGSKCWMKENLKSTHYANGTAMLDGTSAGDITGNYTSKYYFDYANTPANTVTYGKLYTWAAVMNGAASSNANPSAVQGVCPTGWHVPSDAEWNILEKFLDNTVDTTTTGWVGTDIGGKLKEIGTTHWTSPNTGATNSSGFGALPGGYRYVNGSYYDIGGRGYWWSASAFDASSAWGRNLYYSNSQVYRGSSKKAYGFSLRCVRDL